MSDMRSTEWGLNWWNRKWGVFQFEESRCRTMLQLSVTRRQTSPPLWPIVHDSMIADLTRDEEQKTSNVPRGGRRPPMVR